MNAEREWVSGSKSGSLHTLQLETGTSIVVHRHVDFKPDTWLLSGSGFLSGFDRCFLKSKDLEDAKREALHRVYGVLTRLAKRLE